MNRIGCVLCGKEFQVTEEKYREFEEQKKIHPNLKPYCPSCYWSQFIPKRGFRDPESGEYIEYQR
jgi:hypothetical protein